MTTSDFPWEPPIAGTETEHIVGALDRLRTTFRWKADDLDAVGLQTRIGGSSLTIGGLLKHLAFVEAYYSLTRLSGLSPGAPWETVDWDAEGDWPFTSAADDSPEELYALWDGTVERSRAVRRGPGRGRTRSARPHRGARRSSCQPAPAALRPDRGVRPAHRARLPAPRGGGRAGREDPPAG
jgi:hypothetical protein